MNAMRAAALPEHHAKGNVRPRPHLRVVYRADPPKAVSPVPARPASRAPEVSGPTPLRLTRRGRVVVATAVALLVVVLSLVAAGAAQAISHSGPRRPAGHSLAQVVVRPGQSLWSVAETADPDADTRLVIRQIAELNSLTSDTVVAGQQLWVPRG